MKNEMKRLLRQIGALGVVTFHELLREKILWSAFVFAAFCVGLAYAVSQLSFADNARIALDFGMTSIALIGGLISIAMGSGLIAREARNRTLYLVLTKSIWRWQFIVGRLVGLFGILSLNAAIMTVILVVLYLSIGGKPELALLKNFILQVTEFGVLAAIACIFSSFSTTTLAAVFTAGIWLIGHAMVDLRLIILRAEIGGVRSALDFLTRTLPDLTRFDIKAQVSHHMPVTWSYVGVSFAYGVFFIAFAVTASCLIFRKRDL